MFKIISFIATLLLCSISVQAQYVSNPQSCITDYNPRRDYFPNKLTLSSAERFQVSYHKHYKLVKIILTESSTDKTFDFVLWQCGTPKPKNYRDEQIIKIPASSITALSTTHLGFLDKLNMLDRLVGVSKKRYINNPVILQKIDSGAIQEVGQDTTIDIEKLVVMNPDLVMVTGTGNPKRDGYGKLMEMGIPIVTIVEYMENTPLGRTEWIKFIALFFNQERFAEKIFDDISFRYKKLVRKVKNVKHHPTVFTDLPYKGVWYIPGGQSYLAHFLKDAGSEYLWADNPSRGSLPYDVEAVLEKAEHADYWLNPGRWSTIREVLTANPRYRHFRALRPGRIYNNNARQNVYGGNDYWESGIVNPHLILADLVKIFHPNVHPDHRLIWFRPLK